MLKSLWENLIRVTRSWDTSNVLKLQPSDIKTHHCRAYAQKEHGYGSEYPMHLKSTRLLNKGLRWAVNKKLAKVEISAKPEKECGG